MAVLGDSTATKLTVLNGITSDGTQLFNIGTADNASDKKFIISGNNRFVSLGAGGIQAYNGAISSTTTAALYLNYHGGTVTVGGNAQANMSIKGNITPQTDLTYNLGSSSLRWKELYGGILKLQDVSTNPTTSAGARIEFTFDNGSDKGQPVYISYTPHDSYRAPAGLKILGGAGATPAWLEVEGQVYATTFNGALNGGAKYVNLYESRSYTTTLNRATSYVAAGAMFHIVASSSTTTADNAKPPMGDSNVLQMNWDNNGGYDAQLAISAQANRMEFRDRPSTGKAWREVVTSTPGTAAGSTSQPVYISETGVATAITGALANNITGNANTATTAGYAITSGSAEKLTTARNIWGHSFDGSANISGNLTDVGPGLYLPTGQSAFQFLTSTGGAAPGKYGRLLLSDHYSQGDLTNYRLYVNGGNAYLGGNVTITGSKISLTGVGEGLEINTDSNYFGSNADARTIDIVDTNPGAGSSAVDGGLVFRAIGRNSGTDTIQELLRVRNHNGSADWKTGEFQWKTKDVVVELGTTAKTWNIAIAGNAATATTAGYATTAARATTAGYAVTAANATTASKLGTSNVGTKYKPIYLVNGVATASDHEFAGGYLKTNADLNTLYDSGFYSVPGGSATNYPIGGASYANLIVSAYRKPNGNTTTDFAWQLGNFTQSSDRMWYRTSQSNAWRDWRQIVNIATNTAVGDSKTPTYVDTNGAVQALNYTIEKSVPSNAVFTDANVTQTITSTTNAAYRLLMSVTADDTTRTEGVRKDTDLRWNPSSNTLDIAASNANGVLETSSGTLTLNAASTLWLNKGTNYSIIFTHGQADAPHEIGRFNTSGNFVVGKHSNPNSLTSYQFNVIGNSGLSGNLDITGDLDVIGNANLHNTTDAAHSTDTAAAVSVNGGVSVAKRVAAKEVKIDDGSTTKGVTMQYDSTLEVLNFVFA